MMKKTIITTILATALLSFPCSGYAAEYTDLDESNECYTAASRLRDFGIMGGYEDGSFRPDKTITRAEVARLVTSALGVSLDTPQDSIDTNLTSNITFSDVPAEYWASKYIAYLTLSGYLDGYEDGTFRPEDEISYAELTKILVDITGYSVYAEQSGGYPSGYIMYAASLGITEGVDFENSDNATRANAAIMLNNTLNNTLDIPLVLVVGFEMNEAGIPYQVLEIQNGEGAQYQTLLTKLHDIYTVTVTTDDNSSDTVSAE